MPENWFRVTWPCDDWYTPCAQGKHTNSGFYPESYLREMYSYLASYGVSRELVKVEETR